MSATKDYQLIVRRAVEDPDFRERLTENPAGTWEEVTGTPVPDDVRRVVLEDSAQRVHLVLPDPSLTLKQMDESGVAGGSAWGSREEAQARLNADLQFCCADLSHVVCDDARAAAWW
jgi:hypothetical protein